MILTSTPFPVGIHPLVAGMLEEFIILGLATSLGLGIGAQWESLVCVPVTAELHFRLFIRRV